MAEVSTAGILSPKTIDSQMEIAGLLNQFSQKISAVSGAKVKPWSASSLERLQGLSPEAQNQVRKHVQFYMDLMSSPEIELPVNPEDVSERRLLEVCARKLGYVFSSDVYEKLDQDRVVEIYNLDALQIYRSLNFFNLCSYNLSDLLSYEWFELYERSVQVISRLFETTEQLKMRPYSLEPLSLLDTPKHVMREKFSEERLSFFIQFEEIYPIYTWNREMCGVLVTSTGKRASDVESNLAFI